MDEERFDHAGPLVVASAVVAVVVAAVVVGIGLLSWGSGPPDVGSESPSPTSMAVSPAETATASPAASASDPVSIERPLLLGATLPGGGDEILLADWDGDVGENLTDHPANDHPGELSPDGATMVFTSDREGSNDVYVMALATREVRRLTDDPADDWSPVWAPDGSRIAFYRAGPDVDPTVYVIDADGTAETPVTDGSSAANHVDWTPDGEWLIVWMVSDDGDFDVFRMRPDGSDAEPITDTPEDEGSGAVSPDGSLIAFSYAAPDGPRDIWVMRIDGTGRRPLTDDPDEDWTTEPVWSPDGTQVIYQRGVRGSYYVVSLDGGEPTKLFEGPPGGAP